MAFVMLGALATGLIIYKRFWQAFTQPKIRVNQGKKTVLADLHRLAGVWSIWFLMLMSVTGLWYLIQAVLWQNSIEIDPHEPVIAEMQVPKINGNGSIPLKPYSLDNALEIAKHKFPDFKTTYILPPEHNRDTYKLYGSGDFVFYDKYSYSVIVNPWNGAVEQIRTPDNMTALQTLSHIANPLHYGDIGGIWTKLIWFVFGLLLTGMSITGFLMWGGRTVKAARYNNSVTAVSVSPERIEKTAIEQILNRQEVK